MTRDHRVLLLFRQIVFKQHFVMGVTDKEIRAVQTCQK